MSRSCEPLISIIVPVYNAENVIERCLNSIISQTYKNLEIIIIDDGSTDRSGEICDRYQRMDARFKVFHEINSGVSLSRNKGLDNVTGEYIMFVDSDDWIENNICQKTLYYAEKYDMKLVKSLATDWDSNGQERKKQAEVRETLVIDVEKEFSFLKAYATGVVWGTLYSAEILKGLRFSEDLYVGEDTLFFAQAVAKCKNILIVKEKMYNYVQYVQSASHGELNEKRMSNLIAWERVAETFKNNTRISNTAKGAYARQCAEFIQNMCEYNSRNDRYWKLCRKGLKCNIIYAIRFDSVCHKIKYACIYVNPYIWCAFKSLF